MMHCSMVQADDAPTLTHGHYCPYCAANTKQTIDVSCTKSLLQTESAPTLVQADGALLNGAG